VSNQRTLASSASLTGSALHTGENVTLTLLPAPAGHGFKFQRVDLPDEPIVEAAAWSTSAPAPVATPSPTSVGETTDLLEDPEGDPPMPDESGNKLDLARAFIEMGDVAAARMELEQVLARGDEAQREDARRLLDVLH
jgi:FimV-like protein